MDDDEMARRKRNPIGFDDPGYVKRKKKAKKRTGKKLDKRVHGPKLTKKERIKVINDFNYRDRVKRMRGLFGDNFKAADGYDLRKINTWTPAQKAKVTKYFRVIAPRITGNFVVKRYRNEENRNAAIRASLQEQILPGQTAAVFSIAPTEKLEVKVVRGKAKVRRDGVAEQEFIFDKAAFLDNPEEEIDRVLSLTDANVFRIIQGSNKQNKALTRADVTQEILFLMAQYSDESVTENQRSYEEWLDGLVAYPGSKAKTQSKVKKYIKRYKEISDKRRKVRQDERRKQSRAQTRKQLLRELKK